MDKGTKKRSGIFLYNPYICESYFFSFENQAWCLSTTCLISQVTLTCTRLPCHNVSFGLLAVFDVNIVNIQGKARKWHSTPEQDPVRNPKVNQQSFLAALEFRIIQVTCFCTSLRSRQLWLSLWLTLLFSGTRFSLLLCFFSPAAPSPSFLSSIRFPCRREHERVRSYQWGPLPLDRVLDLGAAEELIHGLLMARAPIPTPSIHASVDVSRAPSGCWKGSERGKHLGAHGLSWSFHE